MMLKIIFSNRIKREVKLMKKRGKDMNKLVAVLDMLSKGQTLDEKYKDHQLKGFWKDFRECHIEPDWLLIYRIEKDELILYAVATGSHAYLFKL